VSEAPPCFGLSNFSSVIMTSTALRSRVERILSGDIREQDLHHLFFNMREESGGKGIVSEIANFLAHPQMRTQGIATREVRDLFAFLKFRLPVGRSRIISPVMPANMPDAMRANLRRMRASTLKRLARTNPTHAKRVLERILVRMAPTGFGGLRKPILLDEEEFRIFVFLASYTKGGSLFTDKDLLKDFAHILQKQGLLKTSETLALSEIKPALSLFALTAMHNRVIDLDDGSVATVSIAPDMYGSLGIFAFTEVLSDHGGSGATTAGAWLFQTGLSIADYCEPGIAPLERVAFIGDFEMTPELKLARLG
jgi:hypothetical protein